MAESCEIIIAGFGGQGIMFAGRLLAYAGMLLGKEVSWLPSYGPEMRGGTANCSTIISEHPIGSPVVVNPNVLIALNKPSLEKFQGNVIPHGLLIIDSSLIDKISVRDDIKSIKVPSTQMASDMGEGKLANMIIVGKLIKETGILPINVIKEALKNIVSAKRQNLIDINIKALEIGYNL